jgi:dolichol-phosphate mannosyltransferase
LPMKLISIVSPVYNEESNIAIFVKRILETMQRLNSYDYELILIDDGSHDNSLKLARSLAVENNKIKVISFSRNFGHQLSILAGMNHSSGDAVIVMDSDLQDPPEFIPTLVSNWEKGYDVVYAKRNKRKGENVFKLVTAFLFYRFFDKLTTIKMPMETGDFRLIDRKVLIVFNTLSEKNPFIRGLITWVGFKQIGIEYERDERYSGKTKFSVVKMFNFALDGIVSFSSYPLKIAINIGFMVIILSLFMLLYFICKKLFTPLYFAPGWLSTLIVISFFSGVQLFTIGIIGEYISRIYEEVKNRPRYIINEMINM